MPHFDFRPTLWLILLLVCAPGISLAQGKPAGSAGKLTVEPSARVWYYNGQSRVDLELALDELRLVDVATTSPLSDRSLVARMEGAVAPGRTMDVILAKGAASRRELNERARALKGKAKARATQALLYPAEQERSADRRHALTREIAVKLRPDQDMAELAARYGLRVVKEIPYSPRTWMLEAEGDDLLAALDVANALFETEKVEFATPQLVRLRVRKTVPDDPLLINQWHLRNTGSNAVGAVAGNDVNTSAAWETATGLGVNIAIVDDGLEVAHPDLVGNAAANIDIDINYGDNDPTPDRSADNHGTACAGVAGATGNNGTGVTGAAYEAGLVGVRLISAGVTDALEAQAMLHRVAPTDGLGRVDISSNSWGPSDNGATVEMPGPLTMAALAEAASTGRGGAGTIFAWAAGNGLQNNDNVNYDGYANCRYTIAVGATGAAGQQSWYSEPGAAMLVNAPSNYTSGATGITTTDRIGNSGYNKNGTSGDLSDRDYTQTFGGTSSACPLAAGCIALMLQARPELSWRDVQHILVDTAVKNSPLDTGWAMNGAGKAFNHKFGFGRIDAGAAVERSIGWRLFPPEVTTLTAGEAVAVAIPDNSPAGITRSVTLSGASVLKVEHVEVTVNITHTYRGDLAVTLTSPAGTVSQLAGVRTDGGDNYSNWTFMTVANWGENPNGVWSLNLSDRAAVDTGTLNSWSVAAYTYDSTAVPVSLSGFSLD